MKNLTDYIVESNDLQINESATTIALAVAGGILCYKMFVGVANVFVKNLANKVSIKEFTKIRDRMSEILAKHPDDLSKPMLKAVKDMDEFPDETNYAYLFTDDDDTLKAKITQLGITIRNWPEEEQEEFLKLYKKSAEIWNVILNLKDKK